MNAADIYYVARRLRTWLETVIAGPQSEFSCPLYQLLVLRDVIETPGSTVQEISRRLGMVQSMVSKAILAWEQIGWIRRMPDVQDRRRFRICVTEQVNAYLEPRLSRSFDELLQILFAAPLDEDDRQCFYHVFNRLHTRFKAMEKEDQV